jgi:hypothetical protein
VHRYQVDQQASIHLYLAIWFVALIFLTWFLGTLIGLLGAAEGGARSLVSVASIGVVLGLIAILLTVMLQAAAAFRPEATSPELTATLWDLSYLPLPVFGLGFVVMLLAVAGLVFQTGVLPRWFGAGSALLALPHAVYVRQIARNDGVFIEEIGFLLLVFLWVPLAAILLLLRRSPERQAVGRPAPTT